MSSMLRDSQLTEEVEVVWLEDIDKLDYVRQSLDRVNRGTGTRAGFDDDVVPAANQFVDACGADSNPVLVVLDFAGYSDLHKYLQTSLFYIRCSGTNDEVCPAHPLAQ